MLAMTLFGFSFRRDVRWQGLFPYTWITVALALPAFWLKGAAFYGFMLAILVWSVAIALRLRTIIVD
jgi:hypothetical protein